MSGCGQCEPGGYCECMHGDLRTGLEAHARFLRKQGQQQRADLYEALAESHEARAACTDDAGLESIAHRRARHDR